MHAKPAPQAGSGLETVTTIIVATSKDAPSAELTSADLEVKVDGKAATVHDLRKMGRGPLEYCILFDTSGSGRNQFHLQQSEAQAFLKGSLKAGTDHGRLYLFREESSETDQTADPGDFAPLIAGAEPRSGTALYDAIATCARRVIGDPPSPNLRIMLVFSDGDDNASHIPENVAIEWALKASIRIYSFDPSRDKSKRGRAALQDLARSTGGQAYSVRSEAEMTTALSRLKDGLENQFAVSYSQPTSGRNGLRDFSMKCRKKGVSISAPTKSYRPGN